jgi:hypothetical protein
MRPIEAMLRVHVDLAQGLQFGPYLMNWMPPDLAPRIGLDGYYARPASACGKERPPVSLCTISCSHSFLHDRSTADALLHKARSTFLLYRPFPPGGEYVLIVSNCPGFAPYLFSYYSLGVVNFRLQNCLRSFDFISPDSALSIVLSILYRFTLHLFTLNLLLSFPVYCIRAHPVLFNCQTSLLARVPFMI